VEQKLIKRDLNLQPLESEFIERIGKEYIEITISLIYDVGDYELNYIRCTDLDLTDYQRRMVTKIINKSEWFMANIENFIDETL
jgi:hypothetical protein